MLTQQSTLCGITCVPFLSFRVWDDNGLSRVGFLEIQTQFIIFPFGLASVPDMKDEYPHLICRVFSSSSSGSDSGQIRIPKK